MRHRKRIYTWLNKVTLCFSFGGSRQSLKVREVKCVPGDPAITCPVLFKGSRSPLSFCLALGSLLYVPSLSHNAVLYVLLAMLCYPCGYGIVYPSSCLCRSIFVYKSGPCVYMVVCVVYAYNLTFGEKLILHFFFFFPLLTFITT